jgi:hypothetical protein
MISTRLQQFTTLTAIHRAYMISLRLQHITGSVISYFDYFDATFGRLAPEFPLAWDTNPAFQQVCVGVLV